MKSVVKKGQQVVGNYAFDGFVIGEPQSHPQAVHLWAAQKYFAHGLEIVRKITNKIDGANSSEIDLLVLTGRCEQVNTVRCSQPAGVQETTQRLAVQENDHNFFVR